MKIEYLVKAFRELDNTELYEILKLRNEVFVVEQNCAYQDLDDKDQRCYHLMCFVDHKFAGYTRILPGGVSYPETSIGRVVIRSDYRALKLGKKLMEKSMEVCEDLFKSSTIRIGAQQYLLKFYNSLGFVEVGEPYDEDGIPHIQMIRK
ncbi:GNAT family N-acetyltransferase [Elizabethkingia argentiflava]|uniref:GNAT family N-acetyltransferase n=1 Tax=Elizabethkingia argenteiflava TaxID=2681556 RepID=A0A845Q0G7_9FLAO|nr:GNAT family N-acetyltransferase [Elizabethkingia argenteiflava]NAW52128.1 GNAT family N-acetyltransferase [Elizabethkingia argenteiflava]